MAYDPASLTLVSLDPVKNFRLWHYRSTNALATVNTSAFFADGQNRGMSTGDLVIVDDSDSSPRQVSLATVNDIASGAADIGDGTDITATDSD